VLIVRNGNGGSDRQHYCELREFVDMAFWTAA
jgi:hypothetical protein